MTGITNAGGVAPLYAIISVDYPEGSVCICTNGTKTLKANDTSGKTLFNVPSAGTWTITATDGDKAKSATVDITAYGQSESVTLSYALEIITNGKFSYNAIGSWAAGSSSSGAGSLTEQDGYVQMYGPTPSLYGGSYTAWVSTKALPTSEYKTLYIDYASSFNGFSGVTFVRIGGVEVGNKSSTHDARNLRAVDISGLTSNHQLELIVRVWSGEGHLSPVTIKIYNMYLE